MLPSDLQVIADIGFPLTAKRVNDEVESLTAKLAAAKEEHEKASKEFNAAINHAISLGLDASVFLYAWREGNWEGCKEFGFERSKR